jgi:N-acetylmuramoyl-L-alanine amidase
VRNRCGSPRLWPAVLVVCALAANPAAGQSPDLPDSTVTADTPALSVGQLEYLPGQGREPRSFLLLEFAGEAESYLDLWDATQILQANRYFDPITRKVALGVLGHRIKLTDGSAWVFFDSSARSLGAPCRIVEGRFYLPLSFWPVLLEELTDLPLRRDPDALRLLGDLSHVNVHGVDWTLEGGRLRGVFRMSAPLVPQLTLAGDRILNIRFPGGRLADFDWEILPLGVPIDSLRVIEQSGEASLELHFRDPPGDVRSASDPLGGSWAFTVNLPESLGLEEPEFEGELSETLPDGAEVRRILQRIVLDPGHGGRDGGAVAAGQLEKEWTLKLATWLEPYLIDEGFQVLWTRREDRERRPGDRCQAANVALGDLYLSLHFTRRGRGGARGLEIVLQEAETPAATGGLRSWSSVQQLHGDSSLELASSLQRALEVLTDWPQLGMRRERTAILDGLDMPALLFEAGNLDDPEELAAWEDPAVRVPRLRTLAQGISFRARRWQGEVDRR